MIASPSANGRRKYISKALSQMQYNHEHFQFISSILIAFHLTLSLSWEPHAV